MFKDQDPGNAKFLHMKIILCRFLFVNLKGNPDNFDPHWTAFPEDFNRCFIYVSPGSITVRKNIHIWKKTLNFVLLELHSEKYSKKLSSCLFYRTIFNELFFSHPLHFKRVKNRLCEIYLVLHSTTKPWVDGTAACMGSLSTEKARQMYLQHKFHI